MLKPVIQTENYQFRSAELSSQTVVECRFNQSEGISDIVAVSSQVSLISCEVSSGRVNYGGKLIVSLVCVGEDGKLCRMQKGAEFNHHSDDERLAPSNTALCEMICEKTTVKRDGTAFIVSAIVGVNTEIYATSERTFVTEAEGACLKNETQKVYSATPFSGKVEIEDDFEADSIVDVLIPEAKVLVLNAECSTDEILVNGEIYLNLFAMRGDSPVCLDRVIPFKASIPCDGSSASIGNKADVFAQFSDINVSATVNEERGKCALNFTGDLSISGVYCSETEIISSTDVYSCTNEVVPVFDSAFGTPCVDIKSYSERISALCATKSKLDKSCRFLAVALPKADYVYAEGRVEGSVCAVLVYEQGGEVKGTEVNMPFSVMPSGMSVNVECAKVEVAVYGVSMKLRGEGEVEGEATIKLSASVIEERKTTFLSSIEEGAPLVLPDNAISVYIPEAGDGLWDISKKLNRMPESVQACNPELEYPLTGNERILIYRMKQ